MLTERFPVVDFEDPERFVDADKFEKSSLNSDCVAALFVSFEDCMIVDLLSLFVILIEGKDIEVPDISDMLLDLV